MYSGLITANDRGLLLTHVSRRSSICRYNILTVEGCLFGVMTFGVVMTLRVVGELWRPAGGAYNVDAVLSVMVKGLEEELDARVSGTTVYAANKKSPSRPIDTSSRPEDDLPLLQQGTDLGFMLNSTMRLGGWAYKKVRGVLSKK